MKGYSVKFLRLNIKFLALHIIFLLVILFFISNQSFAAIPFLPASTEPGVIGKVIESRLSTATPGVMAAVQETTPTESPFSPEAAKITFKLNKIVFVGNTVYSDAELEKLYKDKLHKEITVLEFQQIVQKITNQYRNNGYILSRALIPPQHVKNGVVTVRVIEGYVDKVEVQGRLRRSEYIVKRYGLQIAAVKPLQLSVMQHYLRLANEIPGTQVKGVLEASKTTVGAASLILVLDEQPINAYFSYDNYGTRYLGPHELTISGTLNSLFFSGDALRFTYLQTTRPRQLRFYDSAFSVPLTDDGLIFTFGGNKSLTNPGFVLTEEDIVGAAISVYALFQYPLIRAMDKTLTFDAQLLYYDSIVNSIAGLIYFDRIRTLRGGGNYSFSDSWNGINSFALHAEQGLPIWHANDNPLALDTSRFGATGIFTKFTSQFTHQQPLFDKFSAFFLASGQYAASPLLSYEQFTYGGAILGRGYDPAEIIGDRGLAASAELRFDVNPDVWWLVKTAQLYGFYDYGVIWNILRIPLVPHKQDAASTGFGTRFTFNKYMYGNIMITQPLTKKVAAEEIIGEGKAPRLFFSVTASV